MLPDSWWHEQCLTEESRRENHHRQAENLWERTGRGRERQEKSHEKPDWQMDGKSLCDSPFVTFYNKMILFLCFITGLGQSRPKGNSQIWRLIRLGSNQRWTGSKLTGANVKHGSSDPSLFQAWFLIFFHLLEYEGQYYQLIKKNQNINYLPAHVPTTWENTKGEKAHRSAKIPWNSQKCFFVDLSVQLSLSFSHYFLSCFTWHSVHSLRCFQRTQWLPIMPVHLINAG